MVKLGVEFFFFSKSTKIGRFSMFHVKIQFLGGWELFLSKTMTLFRYFLANEGGSRWTPGAIPACVDGEDQPLSLLAADLLLPWLWVKVKVKWSESERWKWKVKQKRFFYFNETFICYRGCLNLNCYISKKVQKNFLMGLKIWWSWGSRIFFSKSPKVGRF